MVHEIHEPEINAAAVLQLPERDVAVCHESEQDCFQHADWVVPEASGEVLWDVLQILFQVDFLHKSVESQHRITNVQKI